MTNPVIWDLQQELARTRPRQTPTHPATYCPCGECVDRDSFLEALAETRDEWSQRDLDALGDRRADGGAR